MKKKTKKIVGIICLIALILILQSIRFTYAKYIGQENGTGKAEIAKWAFKIEKDGQQVKTVNLADSINSNKLTNGKIAPGTAGTFEIVVDATGSEVDEQFEVKFSNEKNKPQNLYFIYGGVEYKTLSEIKTIMGAITHGDKNRTKALRISWKWDYETGITQEEKDQNDIIDTKDAESLAEYKFDIQVTATQVK